MIRAYVSTLVIASTLVCGSASLVRAQDAAPQETSSEQEGESAGLDSGGQALGMNGGTWAMALHLGFGSDTNGGIGFNPFGDGFGPYGGMIGANLSYTFAGAPIFIAAEGDFYIGEKVSGVRSQFLQGTGWIGYNANIGRRFVLRPSLGGGLDALRASGAGQKDFSIGLMGGIDLRWMVFCTDRFFIDGGGRLTYDLTRHNDGDRIVGLTGYFGLGYAF